MIAPLQADMMCPGFGDYHEKLQTFLMWFVDASSFIGMCVSYSYTQLVYSIVIMLVYYSASILY